MVVRRRMGLRIKKGMDMGVMGRRKSIVLSRRHSAIHLCFSNNDNSNNNKPTTAPLPSQSTSDP